MAIEDFLSSIPKSYWRNPIRTVHSSGNSGFIATRYLESVTVIEIPCCVSLTALVDPENSHREDCEALKAVQSWKGRWF